MTDAPIATSGIAAQAMEYLELRPLSSTADDTADARAMKRALPMGRRMCLEAHDFTIASRTVRLYQDLSVAAQFAHEATIAYRLPSDLIAVRDVLDHDRPIPYRREGGHIIAIAARELACRYTADETDETLLPPHLQQAVALQTALLMSDLRSTSTSKKDMLRAQLEDAMRVAIRLDRTGASPQRYDDWPETGDWILDALR